jgi:hypothetical protein
LIANETSTKHWICCGIDCRRHGRQAVLAISMASAMTVCKRPILGRIDRTVSRDDDRRRQG